MGLVTVMHTVATVYLFSHPSDVNFATWAGVTATITGVYHWINYRDDKTPDNNP